MIEYLNKKNVLGNNNDRIFKQEKRTKIVKMVG